LSKLSCTGRCPLTPAVGRPLHVGPTYGDMGALYAGWVAAVWGTLPARCSQAEAPGGSPHGCIAQRVGQCRMRALCLHCAARVRRRECRSMCTLRVAAAQEHCTGAGTRTDIIYYHNDGMISVHRTSYVKYRPSMYSVHTKYKLSILTHWSTQYFLK
jgi:hypothetical protein